TPKKPLFWAIGLGLQTFTLEAKAKGLESIVEVPVTIDGIRGTEFRQIDLLVDMIPMKVLNMPVGVEYRFVSTPNHKFEWFLGAKVIPSYLLNIESSFSAEGFYNLTYEQYGFSF